MFITETEKSDLVSFYIRIIANIRVRIWELREKK